MPPSDDDREAIMLSCRYGDLDEVKDFVDQFGQESLANIRDENGNCVLHMVCGNGHIDILDYLLPIIPPSLLTAQNAALSTPLHWATLNSHLLAVQTLVNFPGGPGIDLIDAKNAAGRSPLGEAELAGWDEGAKWLVQMMKLEDTGESDVTEEGNNAAIGFGDIQVEIEDADGQAAKMTLSDGARRLGMP